MFDGEQGDLVNWEQAEFSLGDYVMELINNPMNLEEKRALFAKVTEAEDRGASEEELDKLIRMYPVSPARAKALKDVFGMGVLKDYNLSEAIAAYGEDYFRN